MDEDQGPSQIVSHHGSEEKTFANRLQSLKHTFCTRNGLLGDYDYAFLFIPNIPFLRKKRQSAPFFGLNDKLPVVLAIILGFQHALAMLAGIITPPIILASSANFSAATEQYLVSAALIVSGLLSAIQITRFHIYKTPWVAAFSQETQGQWDADSDCRYYIGTGLISVVGVSFATITIASSAFDQMYANGYCPTSADGVKQPCPDGYGAFLGTAAVCALTEMLIAFIPPRIMLRIFPPLVTGPTVMLIGIGLIESGFEGWAGGSGTCMAGSAAPAFYQLCPDISAPHALPWGSAEFLGESNIHPCSRQSQSCRRTNTPFPRPGLLRLPHHHPLRAFRLPHHEVLLGGSWPPRRVHYRRRHRLLRLDGHHQRARGLLPLGRDVPVDRIWSPGKIIASLTIYGIRSRHSLY